MAKREKNEKFVDMKNYLEFFSTLKKIERERGKEEEEEEKNCRMCVMLTQTLDPHSFEGEEKVSSYK